MPDDTTAADTAADEARAQSEFESGMPEAPKPAAKGDAKPETKPEAKADPATAAKAAQDALVVARKAELTEAYCTEAKLTDADLLDNTKFELAKALKEIATLKKGGVKPAVTKSSFAKGASDKNLEVSSTGGDPAAEATSRKKINELAFRGRSLTKGGYTPDQSEE